MDSCLTQPIPVELPPWQPYAKAPVIPGYSNITSLTPILQTFYQGKAPTQEGQILAKDLFGWVKEFEGSGNCKVITTKKQSRDAFCKVSHILDPIRSLQMFYNHKERGELRKQRKLDNPMNKAYVDALANYLLGQLTERGLSPHFCLFYGCYRGVAEKYRYDITEEFDSFRKYRVFWDRRRQGVFSLYVEPDEEIEEEDNVDEFREILQSTPKSSLRSTAFTAKTDSSSVDSRKSQGSVKSHISLDGEEIPDIGVSLELQSVGSIPSVEGEEEEPSSDTEGSDEDDDFDSMWSVFAEFKDYPVMLIFQEQLTSSLDDLLGDEEEVGAELGTAEWEARWSAWIFQIVAALCVAQGVLGFTHNDLHTNNIVWKETKEKYFSYRNRDGAVWKVPTYGKVFKIIDYGRAIFRVGEQWFVSDDYEKGGDAEGQYNFGPHLRASKPEILPNPSFDLCRFAVSILDALFIDMPAEKLDGEILSREGSWEVHETESPLWNLLWSWLIDDEGKNVLREENGDEKFPDFDLYQHITHHVHGAKPQEAIQKKLFDQYKVKEEEPNAYPLFC
jgi:hypothetical protein